MSCPKILSGLGFWNFSIGPHSFNTRFSSRLSISHWDTTKPPTESPIDTPWGSTCPCPQLTDAPAKNLSLHFECSKDYTRTPSNGLGSSPGSPPLSPYLSHPLLPLSAPAPLEFQSLLPGPGQDTLSHCPLYLPTYSSLLVLINLFILWPLQIFTSLGKTPVTWMIKSPLPHYRYKLSWLCGLSFTAFIKSVIIYINMHIHTSAYFVSVSAPLELKSHEIKNNDCLFSPLFLQHSTNATAKTHSTLSKNWLSAWKNHLVGA